MVPWVCGAWERCAWFRWWLCSEVILLQLYARNWPASEAKGSRAGREGRERVSAAATARIFDLPEVEEIEQRGRVCCMRSNRSCSVVGLDRFLFVAWNMCPLRTPGAAFDSRKHPWTREFRVTLASWRRSPVSWPARRSVAWITPQCLEFATAQEVHTRKEDAIPTSRCLYSSSSSSSSSSSDPSTEGRLKRVAQRSAALRWLLHDSCALPHSQES